MDDKVRELERQLQAARSELKRYASLALRAQQELAQERRQRAEPRGSAGSDDLEGGGLGEDLDDGSDGSEGGRETGRPSGRVDRSIEAHDRWARKVALLTQAQSHRNASTKAGASSRVTEDSERSDSETQSEAVAARARGSRRDHGLNLHDLKAFLRDQRLCITDLGRENERLRDMLRARPTRQELLGCRLEIDRLQAQLHRLRTRGSPGDASSDQQPILLLPVEEHVPSSASSALSDRIIDDKLLRLLHVHVESVDSKARAAGGRAASDAALLRRSFLRENVFCQLALDSSALLSVDSTEDSFGADERREEIARRIARISSEVVASCCYVLDIEDVAKLPRHVEALQQLAQAAALHQSFAEKLEQELDRFDQRESSGVRRRLNRTERRQERKLNQMLMRVKDALVELDARRQQMKPPGSKAHDVLFESMRLLRVTHIDEVAPNIRRMIVSIQAEQAFERELRELIGLDDSATRQETLQLVSKFFRELGLGVQ